LKTNFEMYSRNTNTTGSNKLKVFNATVNNISVILWQSVVLVDEIGVPGENHLSQVTCKLYHFMLCWVHTCKYCITPLSTIITCIRLQHCRGRRGCDRMVVRFTTTICIMQSVPITSNVVSSHPAYGEVMTNLITQWCIEKTTDLPQVIDKLDHTMVYRVHLPIYGVQTHNFSGDRHSLLR
jgi:hypothetical protein